MQISNGIAYGLHKNYVVTLHEGTGWKAAGIATAIRDNIVIENMKAAFSDPAFTKRYHIQKINITQDLIEVIFFDSYGTMGKIKSALDIILDKLAEDQIPGADHCSHCKNVFQGSGCQIVKIGNYAYGLHDACVHSIENETIRTHNENKEKGSIGRGVAGAIPWAVAYYFGWFVGWLGFLIGFTAQKGYEILKGRETKVKAAVIIIVTMLAVVLAEYVTCLFACWRQITTDPQFASFPFSLRDIFSVMNYALANDAELLRSVFVDVVLGWVFAGLGIYSTIRNIFVASALNRPVLLESPFKQGDSEI